MWADRATIDPVLVNTLALSGLGLLFSWVSVLVAIIFNEVRGKTFKRVAQTVTTFPNFISWIIVYSVAASFFTSSGAVPTLMQALGMQKPMIPIMSNPNIAWYFQTLLAIWKGFGWGAIYYIAAIAGIDLNL